MSISIRPAKAEDRAAALEAEKKATPRLSYLGAVYDDWREEPEGALLVAEHDKEVVAVGKFTVVPDGSAWLEALRVRPDRQGLGIGKAFYERFLALAEEKKIHTLRMYTGVKNETSRGLAERFGFSLAAQFSGFTFPLDKKPVEEAEGNFVSLTPKEAAKKAPKMQKNWGPYAVMNRTFYKTSVELMSDWAGRGFVYADEKTGALAVLGARFLPAAGLHLAMFSPENEKALAFARQTTYQRGLPSLYCMVLTCRQDVKDFLQEAGGLQDFADCLVMEKNT